MTKIVLQPGDVFLTRNKEGGEWGNETPGHWNHAAMYVGDGAIIEAQGECGVAMFTVDSFKERYPEYKLLRPIDPDMGKQAAKNAFKLLGAPYRTTASIFYFLRETEDGENCLTVVRKSYAGPMGFDPVWRIPDHIATDGMFYEIEYKFDDEWDGPGDWMKGIMK